jgi:hypothetical protein
MGEAMNTLDLSKFDLAGMIEAAYREGRKDAARYGNRWENSGARCDAEFVREKIRGAQTVKGET